MLERLIFERLAQRKGVKWICRELKVGKKRVLDLRERAVAAGYLDASGAALGPVAPPFPPLPLFGDLIDRRTLKEGAHDAALLARIDWLRERLEAGWHLVSIFEELGSAGVKDVSRSAFYRFLDRHDLTELGKKIRRDLGGGPIHHAPGEALLVDWGKVRDVLDPATGKRRTLWAFVGVLGFSRYMMVRLVWSNDVPTTFAVLESMLGEIGGVPKRVTSDNPKCFTLKAHPHDPLINPAYLRFAAHFKFTIEALPARQPKKKGKVERLMPYVRRLFESYPKTFAGLDHAQAFMDRKTALANERRHGTTCQKPLEAFIGRESEKLEPLPPTAYEREEVSYPTVRRDGYVRFANKYYAVADAWKGADVVAIATASHVALYAGKELLETYNRIPAASSQTHDIHPHLKKPWEKIEEQNAGLLALARKIGPNTEMFVRRVLERGQGFVDTRVIWGLLSLDKNPNYPREKIEQAVSAALDMHTYSSRLVERLIKLTLVARPPEAGAGKSVAAPGGAEAPRGSGKFTRPIAVYTEHLKARAAARAERKGHAALSSHLTLVVNTETKTGDQLALWNSTPSETN